MESSLEQVTERAKNSALWLGSTNLLWQVISWALTLLTARILNPADYGLIALIETVTPYLALIAAINLPLWLVQTETLTEHEERVIFTICVTLGIIISVSAFLCAPWIAHFYAVPELELPFRVVTISFLLQALYLVPDALLQRELQFKPVAIRRLCVGILRFVVQLVLAMAGMGYWALVIGIVLKELTYAIWMISFRGLPKGFAWDWAVARKALAFGIPATASAVSWVVFSTSDKVIVGRLFGVEILGFYSLAFLLIDLPLSKINSIVRPVLVPYFSRLKDHPEELRRIFLKVVKALALVSFPILLGLASVAPEAVETLLGEKWSPMVRSLVVLCLVGVLRAFADNVPPLLLALGQPKKELLFNFASLVLMPPAFYFMGKFWGMDGLLGAWVVVYPIIVWLILRALNQTLQLKARAYARNMLAPLVSSCVMGAFVIVVGALFGRGLGALPLLMLKVVAGALCYGLVLFTVFRRDAVELLPFLRNKPTLN